MENLRKLKETLSQQQKQQVAVTIVWAIAGVVDWDNKTMTATGIVDDLPYYDVLLGLGNHYIKPRPGSKCLLGLVQNNDAATFLISCQEAEEVELRVKDKILIANEDENLRTLAVDLLDAIIAEKHMTSTGPTIKLTPDSEARFSNLKTRFKNLLKAD